MAGTVSTMSTHKKNAVLCGEIDYHCLLCEETFHFEADVQRHIRWENHRKKMRDHTYVPKYKSEFILKIGSHYYCEVCNTVMPTALKTGLHTTSDGHIRNKEHQTDSPRPSLVKRESNSSIVIAGNIVTTEKEWNGVIDKQCILCDMDLENEEDHITSSSHVINLIQTNVQNEGGNVYRKVGSGDIFYCFICREPESMDEFTSHMASCGHEQKKQMPTVAPPGPSSSGAGKPMSFSDQFKINMKKMFVTPVPTIAGKLSEFQKEKIDIYFEKSKAVCRVCKFEPAFTVEAITGHIKMHKKAENDSPGFQQNGSDDEDDEWSTDYDSCDDDDESDGDKENLGGGNKACGDDDKELLDYLKLDHGKQRAELAKFGKLHHIKMVHAGSKGHCTLCDTYISAHMKNFKQHISGAKHIATLELKGLKTSTKKENPTTSVEYATKPLKQWLKNIFLVKQMDDFWLNRKLCVDKHSFVLLCHIEVNGKYDTIKCFLCDVVFPSDQDQAHSSHPDHKDKLFATKVVTSLKHEFVREIRPSVFHCGFCNCTSPTWALLQRHLRSSPHRERRAQQQLVADVTHDQWGEHLGSGHTAEADLLWMSLMGNRLF